jgi:uncharacterized membrane protein YgdD (TMEM256/DUF423 family)
MANFLIRLGLLIAALAVLGLIFVDTEMAAGHEELPRNILFVGAVIFAGGVVLSAVSKASNVRLWGARCPKCGHSVQRGHIYCEDHFQEALDQARDRLRFR